MLTSKGRRILENFRIELLDELIEHNPLTAVCLFYKQQDDGKYFIDWEIAEIDPKQYAKLLDEEKQAYIRAAKNARKKNRMFDYVNITFEDEYVILISLKDMLYIISDMLYPDLSNEVVVIWVNLWMADMSTYKLAQKLKISKQSVSQFMNGIRPMPKNRLEEIAGILNFEMKEYERVKTDYLFDEDL